MKLTRSAFAALLVAFALMVLVVVGCSGSGGTSGGGNGGTTSTGAGSATTTGGTSSGMTVSMQNFAFNPSTFTVSVGEVVTFKNADSVTHVVNINGQDVGTVAAGATVTWTPTAAGTFPLKCTIHPQMTGTITVK
jgi:plastocyanin